MQPIHRFLTFFAIVCLITATAARASDAAPNTPRTLTLEECIRLALQHNFDVRIQRYGPEIARYNLSVSYAGYEPVLALTGEHSYRLSPGGIDAENRPFVGSETEEDSVGASIRGLMPWGLSYSLGGNVGDSYGTRPGFIEVTNVVGTNIVVVEVPIRIPFENADGQIGVFEMRQPLMRNAWIDSTRLNIQIDKADLKISELALQQQIMTTVTAVENAYYNLIFAQENVRVQEAALQLAERLLAENKKRVEVGAMAPLDEKQAEAQVATSRADLLSARRTLEAQQNLLKNLLTDEYPNWHKVDLQPAEKLLAVPVSLQLYDSWHKGMTMRPDLLQFRENLAKQNIVLSFQKNQLFPQFDLVARYGYSASGDEISPALDQLTNGENPFWSYRAELNIPLGNRRAQHLQSRQGEPGTARLATPKTGTKRHGRNRRRGRNGAQQFRARRGHPPGQPVCRGRARRRTKEARERQEHQLPSAATSARPDRRPFQGNPGAGRLQHRPGSACPERGRHVAEEPDQAGREVMVWEFWNRASEIWKEDVPSGLESRRDVSRR
jgi:outer membrane protein TolC